MQFFPDSSNFKRTTFVIFLSFFFFSLQTSAQDYFGLKEIVSGTFPVIGSNIEDGIRPYLLEANSAGGTLEAAVQFKTGTTQYCTGSYRFEWKFSTPVDRLGVGQSVEIEYTARIIEGSACRSSTGKMIVMDGVGLSNEFKSTGITRVSGISVQNRKWLNAQSPTQTYTSTAKVINASNKHATIKFNFDVYGSRGSERMHYEVVYLFERGYQKKTGCDPDMNCHNLYSLGVLIGFAEFGALVDQEPPLVAEQLTGAIAQAEASKCVSPDKIIALRNKVQNSTSSHTYYQEISALRQEIALFVQDNCNCCK
ncbi:MAG: hypothetical protein KJP00_13850 [Bacteroidia bacterium]|nr:hypothetical protein [Bacteroidia bacterium]